MLNLNQSDKIVLCRKGSGCGCPTIKKSEDGNFIITDDYEGSVRLTSDEMEMLRDALNENDSKNI